MASSTSSLTPAEDGEGRKATFTFDDIVLPASLKDLPTIVESYKTYDDITLVKTGDIGQVERHPVLAISLCLSVTSSSRAQERHLRLKISTALLHMSCVTVCSMSCYMAQEWCRAPRIASPALLTSPCMAPSRSSWLEASRAQV